jgi:DNA-binding transcriptional regulator YdaS (Cro superfamily)
MHNGQDAALRRAIEIFKGQTPLAKRLGVSQSLVSYWLNIARRGVPAHQAIAIERVTRRQVTRQQLRPDLFGNAA